MKMKNIFLNIFPYFLSWFTFYGWVSHSFIDFEIFFFAFLCQSDFNFFLISFGRILFLNRVTHKASTKALGCLCYLNLKNQLTCYKSCRLSLNAQKLKKLLLINANPRHKCASQSSPSYFIYLLPYELPIPNMYT